MVQKMMEKWWNELSPNVQKILTEDIEKTE